MPTLHEVLQQSLRDWRDHLDQSWLDMLGDTGPAFDSVDRTEIFYEDHPMFPTLQGNHSRTFRAFDQLTPENVKVVLIAQDPYPSTAQATGRAFEQGDLPSWVPLAGGDQPRVLCKPSLQSIVQQLATLQTANPLYSRSKTGWKALKTDVRQGGPLHGSLPTPPEVFDQWQNEGVLMLNAALTFTKKSQQNQHVRLWRPFVQKLNLTLGLSSRSYNVSMLR